MNVSMCGPLLSSLVEESSNSDAYHHGVLYGTHKTSKHLQQTDTEEDCLVTTTDMSKHAHSLAAFTRLTYISNNGLSINTSNTTFPYRRHD